MAGKVFFFARSPDAPSTTTERQPPDTLFSLTGLSDLDFSETAGATSSIAGGAPFSAVVPILKGDQAKYYFLRHC